MDIFVLCISVESHENNAGWGALLIEPEGFIEERHGHQPTTTQAILHALGQILPMVPSGQRLAIRGTSPTINHFGKVLVPQWKKSGCQNEQLSEEVSMVLRMLNKLETVWMNAARYPQPGDVRSGILAREAIMNLPTESLTKQEVVSVHPPPTEKQEEAPTTDQPKRSKQISAEQIELLFGYRLMAYINAVNQQNRGAWSCVLVDRKSKSALLKSDALFGSPMRLLLQGTLQALRSLNRAGQKIEIRSSHRNLIQLGENWIWDWHKRGWKKKGGKSIANLPLVQELHAHMQKHKVQWKFIPANSDEYGIQHARLLTQAALKALECGEKTAIESRQQNYPTYQLL